MKSLLIATVLLATLLPAARAEEGHSHDAPAAAAGPVLPRFVAVSEAFELVGVVNGRQLALYLDRFDDNSPVPNAKLELEVAGRKVAVSPHAPGEYEATLPEPLKPGVTPVTASLEVKGETDLLASDIDIHEDRHPDEKRAGWPLFVGWGAAALAALAIAVAVARRRAAPRAVGGAA